MESHLGQHIGRKGVGGINSESGLFEDSAGEELAVGVMVLGFGSDRDEVVSVAEDVEVGAVGYCAVGENDGVGLVEVSPGV